MEDEELKQYKDIIEIIKKNGERISVSKESLHSVLSKVTKESDNRYYNWNNQEGSRPSLIINLFAIMSKKAYLIVALALVVLAGGAFWYTKSPVVAPGVGDNQPKIDDVKTASALLATEVANEVGAFDVDVADLNDFNSAQNEAELDALNKDLASLNGI